jgi:putative transposase
VPRARLNTPDGKTTEWKSKALRPYQRRTLVADALIAGAYALAVLKREGARSPGSGTPLLRSRDSDIATR